MAGAHARMLVGQQHVYASIILGPYAAGLVILKKNKNVASARARKTGTGVEQSTLSYIAFEVPQTEREP
jgi:hypothetical protein